MSTFSGDQPVKLTKKFVDKAPAAGKKQIFYRDSLLPGFGLRVTANGSKAYIVEKRINGRSRRVTLGKHPLLTPELARRKAQQFLGQVAFGIDPIAEARKLKARTTTLESAFNEFKNSRSKDLHPKTIRDYERAILRDLQAWTRKPITNITPNMVLRRHRELTDQKGNSQADLTFRCLRAVFNFAIYALDDGQGNGLVLVNPVLVLTQTKNWNGTKRRQTILKKHQISVWFKAVCSVKQQSSEGADTVADFLILILFTGLRFSEAAKLKWSQIDLEEKFLYLPKSKNGEPFSLPLSDFVVTLLKTRQSYAINEYVFPGRDGNNHLVEPKRQIEHIRKESGLDFVVHDLRRTFITIAESLDLSVYSIKRLVNHKVSNDVTDGYIISDVERLREPMHEVTNYLLELIGEKYLSLYSGALRRSEQHRKFNMPSRFVEESVINH